MLAHVFHHCFHGLTNQATISHFDLALLSLRHKVSGVGDICPIPQQ
jgi:hypothetical protein